MVKWEHHKYSYKQIATEIQKKEKNTCFRAIMKNLQEKVAFEDDWFS